MIWKVPPIWRGETCVILAGGPSLRGFDISFDEESLRNSRAPIWRQAATVPFVRVITINDSWLLAPRADMHYFCDGEWWTNQIGLNRRSMDGLISFHDRIYKGFWVTSGPGFQEHPQVHALRLTGEKGLETDPTGLRHGSNSGYQAINLAYHLGVNKIILLGYDMKCQGERTHWHNEARASATYFEMTLAKAMLPNFATLVEPLEAAGVQVINATPDSDLECFPKMGLQAALGLSLRGATSR